MAEPAPPEEIMIDFLQRLSAFLGAADEPLIPVLRGSLLLRHWFDERARPAGDIDLECFARTSSRQAPPEHRAGGYGHGGRYSSMVEYCRNMCTFTTQETTDYHWGDESPPLIEFEEADIPPDGQSLWEYGTPGERFYIGWIWHAQRGRRGLLQIDIAEAGTYRLEEIDVADVHLALPGGQPFRFVAYTPEMMLAAKLSWLMRSFTRRAQGERIEPPLWKGEPKDLFDAHLLATQAQLSPDKFSKCLLAIGADDELDWDGLEGLFDARRTRMHDSDFPNWEEFRERHADLATTGPADSLRELVARLEPLLGDFYLPEETPFLMAIHANPKDESAYAIYADWLEEHGDSRAEFLRQYSSVFLRPRFASAEARQLAVSALQFSWRAASQPWLQRLFGSTANYRVAERKLQAS